MKRSLKYFSKVLYLGFFFFLLVSLKKVDSYGYNYQHIFADSYVSKINQESPLLVLEIPQLNLVQNVYNFDSKLNDVKYHVAIMPQSNLPDAINGHLFLAAHAGNSKISYFKNLNNLENNDIAVIIYKNHKYIYEVTSKDITLKKDYVDLKIDDETNILYLITCYQHTNRLVITLSLKVII